MFRGGAQSNPKDRLAQARIFLADEDYYRNLRFTEKLADIAAYIVFLEKYKYKREEKLIKDIKEMIWVHKCWITEATQPPILNLKFAKFDHKNRLIGLIKDPRKRRTIAHIKAPQQPNRLSKSLDPGPATHMTIDDWSARNGEQKRPTSPNPFLYSKKVAQFRRAQNSIATAAWVLYTGRASHEVRPVPAPSNLNGPYIPLYDESREDLSQRLDLLLGVVQNLRDVDTPGSNPLLQSVITIIDSVGAKGNINARSATLATADMDMLERLYNTKDLGEVKTVHLLPDQKAVEEAARKVNSNILSLKRLLGDEVDSDPLISKEIPTIRAVEEEVQNTMMTSLIGLAEPLSPGQPISGKEASRLLQKQLIAESHCSVEERKPNFSEIWAYGADIQTPKNFFSLDRWPLELQTIERHREILESGPERPSLENIRKKRQAGRWLDQEKERNGDPKETYIHGKPYFEFGETAFQEKALSWQIEQNLANGESFFCLVTVQDEELIPL